MDAASSSMDTRVQHLARVSLFSDCTDDELRRIADISRIAEAPAATRLTEAGAAGDSFFFIIDGRVSVETPIGAGDSLQPGEILCLVTDGVSEATGRTGELMGRERVRVAFENLAPGTTSAEALSRLRAAMDGFLAGATPSDDLALLAVRWSGRSQPEASAASASGP